MKRHGIPLRARNHLRYDFLNSQSSNLSEYDIKSLPHFHFRVKHRKMRESMDISIMNRLYKLFYTDEEPEKPEKPAKPAKPAKPEKPAKQAKPEELETDVPDKIEN
jgi:hypothetical protein